MRAADPTAADRQPGVTVVIATRNRRDELCRTLDRLTWLPGRPPVIVVDNASADGTPRLVARRYPQVRVICLGRNAAAAARNVGVRAAATRYVAFSDDDSWWQPGALGAAVTALDDHPRIGLVAARIVVGPAGLEDPVTTALRRSPLPSDGLPGPRVLGFLACAAIVRRSAFLSVGGFSDLLVIGAEEALLAMDLAAARWVSVYLDRAVAEHWPSSQRDSSRRRALELRNQVLIAWLRRPAGVAARQTLGLLRRAPADSAAAAGAMGVLRSLPRALSLRRPLPRDVELALQAVARARFD